MSGRGTYRISANGSDEGLAERGELAPVFEELVLENLSDCVRFESVYTLGE